MSRQLPARPNLEHLKNQARDLLIDLRRSHADAQLADAQFALARDYGFANWPALKLHVESLVVDAAPPRHPFEGAWTVNIARSRFHPAHPVQRATLEIAVAGETVTFDDVTIDEGGREERHRNTVYTDGREHPSDYGNDYVIRAAWRGSRILEVTGRQRDQDAGRVRYEVSADGLTLTVTDPRGEYESVFDRR